MPSATANSARSVVDEEGVFVVAAHAARVSVAAPAASLTGRPRARSRRPARGRPCATCVGSCDAARRSRTCRCVEPRSSTQSVPSRSNARACTCETNVSNASGTAQPPPRPIVTSPSTGNVAPASVVGLDERRAATALRARAPRRRRRGDGRGAAGAGAGRAAQLARDDPARRARGTGRAARGGRTSRTVRTGIGHRAATTPRSGSRFRRRRSRRRRRACARCTTTPLTVVPFSRAEVDDAEAAARSRRTSAWWRETCGSESATAQSGRRPITVGLLAELRPGGRRAARARRPAAFGPATIVGVDLRGRRRLRRSSTIDRPRPARRSGSPRRGACSRTASASSRDERVAEAGEALEVVGRERAR